LWEEESKTWEKRAKQYTNKTSIKRVASISLLKSLEAFLAKPQPPEANGGLMAEARSSSDQWRSYKGALRPGANNTFAPSPTKTA